MKRALTILFLLAGSAAVAQNKISAVQTFTDQQAELEARCHGCHCGIIQIPFTLISGTNAEDRFTRYKDKTKACGLGHCARGVLYSPEGAKNLLIALSDKKKYNGFRTYFAVYPGKPQSSSSPDSGYKLVPKDQWNKLTLIYVPTKKEGSNGDYHPDDITQCMIINGKSIEIVDPVIASMWIRKAEIQVLNKLETKARETYPEFMETHSLWFSNTHAGSNFLKNGLLDILKCRTCCKGVTSVEARFGAFSPKNKKYNYKLTVVFMLNKGDTANYISLYSGDILKATADKYPAALADQTGGSDTGKPCPPPTPCTGQGSGLPVQP